MEKTYTKIGRIRPDYADVWDSARSYTALEVVKSADAYHAYIAKQDVPAGTPPTDTDYWGEVLDVSDVIAESVAATNRANTAAENADAAREGIQGDFNAVYDELRTKGDDIRRSARGCEIILKDAANDPLRGLKLYGKTKQDGMPTPDAPVPLVSVGDKGSVGVTATGKNLIRYPYLLTDSTENGIAINVNVDGTITFKGVNASTGLFTRAISTAHLTAGTYVLSGGSDKVGYQLWEYNDQTYGTELIYSSFGVAKTITLQRDSTVLVRCCIIGGTDVSETVYFQLERGAIATKYESIKPTQTLTTLTPNGLPGIPVSSGGNYTDADGQMWVCDEVDLGKGVYVQRVGRLSQYAGLTSGTHSSGTQYVIISAPGAKAISGVLSTHYAGSNNNTNVYGRTYLLADSIVINDNRFTDAATAKVILGAEKPEFIYVLATPIETPLTAEEIAQYRALQTYNPITTIFNDSNAEMDIEYVVPTETYVAEVAKEARIDRSPAIVCTAEGETITLTDSSNDPMKGLRIFGKTTQDGTPTPENPVPLVSVGESGSVGVTATGKNLLPFPYTAGGEGTVVESNGGKIICLAHGGLDLSGTPTGYIGFRLYKGEIIFKGNQTFTLMGEFGNYFATVFLYTDESLSSEVARISVGSSHVQFNTDNYPTATYMIIETSRRINDAAMHGTVYPMITAGEAVPTTYESYKPAQTITAQTPNGLPGIPVSSGGNYTDADGQMWLGDEKDLSKGVYVQRVGEKIMDGVTVKVSDKAVMSEKVSRFNIWGGVKIGQKLAICTHYLSKNWLYDTAETAICSNPQSELISFYEVEKKDYTVDEYNAWLADEYANGTPVTVQYVLATPIETALTPEELAAFRALHTNYLNTTVFNDAGAHMAMEYNADAKIYIDNTAEQIDAAREAIKEDFKELSERTDQLSEEIIDVIDGSAYGADKVVTGNIFPLHTDFIDGKYYSELDGQLVTPSNSTYCGFIIKVRPNTEYACTNARYVQLLDSDKTTVLSNHQYKTTFNSADASYAAISFDKNTYPIESYCISVGTELDVSDYKIKLDWLHVDDVRNVPGGLYVEKANPAASEALMLADYNNCVKYNKLLVYSARFTGDAGTFNIYHGSGTYCSSICVDATNVTVNTDGSSVLSEAHNLTLSNYVIIVIDVNEDKATIKVASNGSTYTKNDVDWKGWKSQIFARSSIAMTHHEMRWVVKDITAPVFVFGDSYLSKTSQERWGYYIDEMGYNNWLACGFPGATSADIIPNVPKLFDIKTPLFAVWALGMNDPDTAEGINASWEANAKKFVKFCNQYNVTPIFVKIPNAHGNGAAHLHDFKNAWIDNSGCRFVDVPKAVGATADGYWYDTLLANDAIHPSWRGASVIAYQYLIDVPELVYLQN